MEKKIEVVDIMQHVHDGDCPKCKFPETVYVRNVKTGKLLKEKCSSRNCNWEVIY